MVACRRDRETVHTRCRFLLPTASPTTLNRDRFTDAHAPQPRASGYGVAWRSSRKFSPTSARLLVVPSPFGFRDGRLEAPAVTGGERRFPQPSSAIGADGIRRVADTP